MSERRRSPKVRKSESPEEDKAERLKAKGQKPTRFDTVQNNSAPLMGEPHSEITNSAIDISQSEINELPTANSKLLTETMEVHHHPEVEKKGFKEYILEGLMIFLAVTMGFIAESIRDGISDRAKEYEYITSMVEDARTDTANIHWCIRENKVRLKAVDSLAKLFFDYDASKPNDLSLYLQYGKSTYHPDFVSPVERTLTQLKNSGSMRLIRKKAAVDSIIAYDDEAKKLNNQQTAYAHYLDSWAEQAEQIFNLRYMNTKTSKLKIELLKPGDITYNDLMLTRDKKILTKAGNSVSIYGGVVDFYIARLRETEVHSINLIHTLQKEYDLKDDQKAK